MVTDYFTVLLWIDSEKAIWTRKASMNTRQWTHIKQPMLSDTLGMTPSLMLHEF